MNIPWDFLTDFGDSAVTVPLALLTLVFLLIAGRRPLALAWTLVICGCAIVIGALKLLCGACGAVLALGDIVSPSGHTAMSTAIYGSLALLVGTRMMPLWRWMTIVVAAVAVIVIAVSRVALGDHTPAEIAVGLVVGASAVAVFAVALRRHEAPALPLGGMMLAGIAIVAVMHGTRWMVEPQVHRLAWDFRLALPFCR